MTKNWLFITLYLMFVALATFMVSMYTDAEKRVEFLKSLQVENESDNLKLIASTIVANKGDGTNAIVHKTPLYEMHFVDGDDTVSIYMYKLVQSAKNYNHSLVILIKDLNITDTLLYKDEDQYSKIRATIKFNQQITIGQTEKQTFDETMVTLYDDTSKLLLINFDSLKAEDTIRIESIYFTYDDTNFVRNDLVTLYNSDLIDQIPDKFDTAYDRNIQNVNSENIYFLDDETIKNAESNSDLYFDKTLISKFGKFNLLYLKNVGILLLFVLPLTYFIFFHGEVYRRFKIKRTEKKALQRLEIEALKDSNKEKGV